MKVVIAAAGTGGHINPGIAIANKIKKEDKNAQIIFIGTNRGLENDLVPRAGYELKQIEAYGINRKISVQNIKNMFKTLKSFKEAKKIIKDIKPDLVIGTGGYICGPTILAAKKYKVSTMLHESNAFPGVSVKLLANKVDTVLVGFADAKKRLTKAKKVVVTGTPSKVKKIELTKDQKEELKKQYNITNDLPIVLIFGGSQGAKTINNAVIEIIQNNLNNNYQIIWSVGQKQYNIVQNNLKDIGLNINNISNTKIVPYIYNMEEIMNLVDLIIARSGAMTITEVAEVGKPAIFIPFPFATENHQEYNAKVLENVGAAKIILDKDLNKDNLNDSILEIVCNKEKMKKMGHGAKKIAINNAEEKIFGEIKKISSKQKNVDKM